VESLEDRTVPATFTVTTTADAGPGSFRQAILDANATYGYDTIAFDIAGSGVHSIQPLSQLPNITDAAGVLISGYSQPGSSANTLAVGDNAVLTIQLDGTNAGGGSAGLTVTGGNSTIQGLVVNHFGASGIRLTTAGSNTVRGNFIGTDSAGAVAVANGDGVRVDGASSSNTIGGSNPDQRNVISGNSASGVHITDVGTTGNVIRGNYIGSDKAGMVALGNNFTEVDGHAGIEVTNGADSSVIGGTAPGAGNLISGNSSFGIQFLGGNGGDLIQGNLMDVNATVSAALGNDAGIQINATDNITIGGTASGAGNVLCDSCFIGGGSGTVVQGNYFGTNPAETIVFPNNGIDVYQSQHVLIGGTAPGAGNVIVGAINNAIVLRGRNNNDNTVQGNYIGTNPAGAVLGNVNGIYVNCGDSNASATGDLIGGTAPGAANVIGCSTAVGSGNGYGIRITGDDSLADNGQITNVVVQGNYIGTNAAGANLGNGGAGVVFAGFNQLNNTIGGTGPGAGNTIAFNHTGGVVLFVRAGTGNSVRGNSIHDNGGLGIDLYYDPNAVAVDDRVGADGVTLNDSAGHVGPNNYQNFPVLTLAEPGSSTHVVGTLNSTANTTFAVDFYANSAPDDTLYGQGERYLGAINVTTNGTGNATFDQYLAAATAVGEFVSATATDPSGNTSEFSFVAPAGTPAGSITVTNTNNRGPGSLRQAILFANLHSGPDTIDFNIPGAGVHTIQPLSPLPEITGPVTIDGYTQPGASANTLNVGDDAVLRIELDGTFAGGADGLSVSGGDTTIRGLVINRFSGSGIRIDGGSGDVVEGNFIGLNSGGTATVGSGGSGVFFDDQNASCVDNLIGGASAAARNVIAGWGNNVCLGVNYYARPLAVSDNSVQGNYLGTNAAGNAAAGGGWGVFQQTYGGGNEIIDNLISGNGGYGVVLGGDGATVQGNLIGTDATGQSAIPNGGNGIYFFNPGGYIVGGTAPGQGNVVAFNNGLGIEGGSVIAGNSVHDNTAGGIKADSANGNADDATDTAVTVESNVVFSNGGVGVELGYSFTDAQIVDNSVHDNSGPGVQLDGGATGTVVGGNAIHDNGGPGVWVETDPFGADDPFGPWLYNATDNRIRQNSIYDNAGLGIVLGGDIAVDGGGNPTTDPNQWSADALPDISFLVANDPLDADLGANNSQNFPVLALATTTTDGTTTVTGTLNSVPNTTFRIEFFASAAADPSGHGQGQTYLGYADVTTDANGDARRTDGSLGFTAAGLLALPGGQNVVSATATNLTPGDTSEFSADVQVSAGGTTTAQATTSADANAFVAAVQALPAQSTPVTTVLNAPSVDFSDFAPTIPAGVTLVVNGAVFHGGSPALVLGSGSLIITGSTFENDTNAPTILVTGGSLKLRNCIVQESTGFNQAAISVTGGTVNLGTTADPGGNTINVNGRGTFVHNTTAIPVAAVGDMFTVNGAAALSMIHGLVWVDFNDDGQVDFGEKAAANVTVTLTGTDDLGNPVNVVAQTDPNGIYSFTGLRPSNAAGYTMTESQPAGLLEGTDAVGMVNGVVSGSDAVQDVFSGINLSAAAAVGENYNFGEQPQTTGSVITGQTATIGFWQNNKGQVLIQTVNGGSTATQLGHWLADTFPNIYASLDGKTNAQVAAFYKSLFARTAQSSPGGPPKTDAQVMATALAVYVTNQTLAGTTATAYGFLVTAYGVGDCTFNVGADGAAFGVANNTSESVLDLLLAVNARSHSGLLYDMNANGQISSTEASFRTMANDLFSAINQAGGT
jgi:hypothetical protein